LVIEASAVSVKGEALSELVSALGIRLSGCAGAVSEVRQNSLIEARAMGTYAEGIRVSDGCDPSNEENVNIVAGGREGAFAAGIECESGCACRILDNADIHAESSLSTPGSSTESAGILCGGCSEVSGNRVSGLAQPLAGCFRPCDYVAVGLGLYGSDTLVERNRIDGGCADSSTGVRIAGGAPRIENNLITGRPRTCPEISDGVRDSNGIAITSTSTAAEIHSNTIDGGGSTDSVFGCTSAAVRQAATGGVFKNNLFMVDYCDFAYPFLEETPTSDPSVVWNNDFAPHPAALALYLDEGTTAITTAAGINALPGGFSGNFSADPELVDYPYDFHLTSSSPCIDAGVTNQVPPLDFDGEAREASAPDVGADEWSAAGDPCYAVTCSGRGSCSHTFGVTSCACDGGFEHDSGDVLTCVDIDECQVANGGCDPLTTCTNTPGSRSCGACPSGYTGTGEDGCVAVPPSCAGLTGTECAGGDCCLSLTVPGGSFPMGRGTEACTGCVDGCPPGTQYCPIRTGELPEHTATVSTFLLDAFEVTVGRFRAFMTARGSGYAPSAGDGANPNVPGSGWQASWPLEPKAYAENGILSCDPSTTYTATPGQNETKPINCITWYEAFAFCAWDGAHLPTVAELEYAQAGGAENRLYPWGSEAPDYDRVVILANNGSEIITTPEPVGSKPAGVGRFGQLDLAGSLAELVLDYSADYGSGTCDDCANLTPNAYGTRVARGGFWISSFEQFRSAWRGGGLNRADYAGVRCARAAP
jgi:formylglycine-generating enzyme required for sulfatase activity